MALNADTLLDRIHLKNQAQRWRIIAILIALLAAFLLFGKFDKVGGTFGDHIARITIEDIIIDDIDRHEMLMEVAEDPLVKAVIIRMDSPGGTTVGSDQLYKDLRHIAKDKPVICTMRNIATSGGYLGAIAADYIIANPGTLTGSIGVILQSAEFTNLAEKLGITPITVKSGELKGSPTTFEKFGKKEEALLQSIINDFQVYFLNLVQERRKLNEEQIATISDGRVVSAQQALSLNLIDAIGGEEDALAWLLQEHQLDPTMNIVDIEQEEDMEPLEKFIKDYTSSLFGDNHFTNARGMLSLWKPELTQALPQTNALIGN